MKLHRFLLEFIIFDGWIEIIDTDVVNQMRNVLKLTVGEQVLLCNGTMDEVVGEIVEVRREVIKVKVIREQKNENEAQRKVVLYCAIVKRENFELVVQKATELGVSEIVPIITRRTVKLQLKQERLQKIIKEAGEQSGRGVLPVLHEPRYFQEQVAIIKGQGVNVLFDRSGEPFHLLPLTLAPINIWVGPEGGFEESEVLFAKKAGFYVATLGKLTLRAETAAIVACFNALM